MYGLMMNAYVKKPWIAKVAQRGALTTTYASTLYVAHLITVGNTNFSDVIWTGWLILGSSIIALIGVTCSVYRLEWVALLPLVTGLVVAGLNIWNESTGFATGLIFGISSYMVYRFVLLTVYASHMREITRKINETIRD